MYRTHSRMDLVPGPPPHVSRMGHRLSLGEGQPYLLRKSFKGLNLFSLA